jgi:hypothetical protein
MNVSGVNRVARAFDLSPSVELFDDQRYERSQNYESNDYREQQSFPIDAWCDWHLK